MEITQEPKYGIKDNRLYNRSSGEVIPDDEPVFIFRAKDALALEALKRYINLFHPDKEHHKAISERIKDFEKFAGDHPERMKYPDTLLENKT